MLLPLRPSDASARRLLGGPRRSPYSYAAVGMTRGGTADGLPPGFSANHWRDVLGSGPGCFAAARAAIRAWAMYQLPWTTLFPPAPAVRPGAVAVVRARHLGLWSLNAVRVAYVLEETGGPVERWGFAIGTLADHVERGEERFTVEWCRADWGGDDTVWYEVLAFAAPRHPLARLGYPLTRLIQRRFAGESYRAVRRAVWSTAPSPAEQGGP